MRKRHRAGPLEARAPRLVIGKFKPSDLKDIKNTKKRQAKPKTQGVLRHKEIIHLHKRLKTFKGVRNEAWTVARGVQRSPVERGRTAPPAVLVNQMKAKLEDSPSAEDIWVIWPSSFAKLEKQWDDIYVAEFPEAMGTPRWGTPAWKDFLTEYSRFFIARPAPRAQEVKLWKDIPEYEPEISLELNPIHFIMPTLSILGARLGRGGTRRRMRTPTGHLSSGWARQRL
ncbi:hypothetical protein ACSSS7_004976 [Eimeria intestinalis]